MEFDWNRFPRVSVPIEKSASASGIVESRRGFKPSDKVDPLKKDFLTALSKRIWCKTPDNTERDNKPIDLEKLFKPAEDFKELTPSKNRKMYASSSFYSPLHPTVQDQVELARRISSSLCDISNKQSKGQSMYVNRMKRSVKWVHGGEEHNETTEKTFSSNGGFGRATSETTPKNPLKLVMSPYGKVQDLKTLTKQGVVVQSPLSPEICFDLVKDLTSTKGKGAELFAKRRKKSEKWVVDENTVKQSSNPGFSIQQRLTQPNTIKLVKSPWESAEETGSSWQLPSTPKSDETSFGRTKSENPFRGGKSALYMPNIPKGWTRSSKREDLPATGLPHSSFPPSTPIKPQSDSDSDFFGYGSDSGGKHQPKTWSWNLNTLNNYNTAPRGWQPCLDYYRPVTFSSSHGTFHA